MEFVPAAMLALLVKNIVDFLRFLKASDWNGVVTTLTAWVAGVVGLLLVGESDWAGALSFGDVSLDSMNLASKVFAGMTVAATAAGANELFGSIDEHRSTAKPHLVEKSE